MSEIKTNFEFPRGEDNQKYQQRIAQDLSKNFKALIGKITSLNKDITTIQNSSSLGYTVGQFISITFPATTIGTHSVSHTLGVIPKGWVVSDVITLPGINYYRTSWDATSITFHYDTSGRGAFTAYLYIMG